VSGSGAEKGLNCRKVSQHRVGKYRLAFLPGIECTRMVDGDGPGSRGDVAGHRRTAIKSTGRRRINET